MQLVQLIGIFFAHHYVGSSRYSLEQGSYNLSLPRTLYGDDINGNSHADPMTQSCHIPLQGSDHVMSSSMHVMANSMHPGMLNNGRMITTSGGSRTMAWNEKDSAGNSVFIVL